MIILSDIDGTLANSDHRVHYLQQKPKDWMSFYAESVVDPVYEHINYLLEAMFRAGHQIHFITGRDAGQRAITEDWLFTNEIHYDGLHMPRVTGDYRQDSDVKEQWFLSWPLKSEVLFILEDRDQCVKMWRNHIPCLQVKDGNY